MTPLCTAFKLCGIVRLHISCVILYHLPIGGTHNGQSTLQKSVVLCCRLYNLLSSCERHNLNIVCDILATDIRSFSESDCIDITTC